MKKTIMFGMMALMVLVLSMTVMAAETPIFYEDFGTGDLGAFSGSGFSYGTVDLVNGAVTTFPSDAVITSTNYGTETGIGLKLSFWTEWLSDPGNPGGENGFLETGIFWTGETQGSSMNQGGACADCLGVTWRAHGGRQKLYFIDASGSYGLYDGEPAYIEYYWYDNGTIEWYAYTDYPGTPIASGSGTTTRNPPKDQLKLWAVNLFSDPGFPFGYDDINISQLDPDCVPDWSCTGYATSTCLVNDTTTASCNAVTDLNSCNVSYSGDYAEFAPQVGVCDYCVVDSAGFSAPDMSGELCHDLSNPYLSVADNFRIDWTGSGLDFDDANFSEYVTYEAGELINGTGDVTETHGIDLIEQYTDTADGGVRVSWDADTTLTGVVVDDRITGLTRCNVELADSATPVATTTDIVGDTATLAPTAITAGVEYWIYCGAEGGSYSSQFIDHSGLIETANVNWITGYYGGSDDNTYFNNVEGLIFEQDVLNLGNDRYVSVDSANLPAAVDTEAELTFYGVNLSSPYLLRDGAYCSACSLVNNTGVDVTFLVPGFSNYTLMNGTPAVETSSSSGTSYAVDANGKIVGIAQGGNIILPEQAAPKPKDTFLSLTGGSSFDVKAWVTSIWSTIKGWFVQ